jgi:hypothetical protein
VGALADAVQDGSITDDESARLLDDVTRAVEAGDAFASVTMFAVVGRRL